MKKWLGVMLILAAGWPGVPRAQEVAPGKEAYVMEEVVVTATRTEVPGKETSVSYTVITEKEIAERQATRVEELLRTVPGVTIN